MSIQVSFRELTIVLLTHLYLVGYKAGEQHISKSGGNSSKSDLPPQAGTHGQPDSHISGQGGPEIMGGKLFNSSKKSQKLSYLILFKDQQVNVLLVNRLMNN